jgi:hypothetical protein
MPNQYNAADLTNVPAKSATTNFGDGYPIPSASGTGMGANSTPGDTVSVAKAGFFPATSAAIVDEYREDAPDVAHNVVRNVEPGNAGGAGDTSVDGAFDGGITAAEKVIDFEDAAFPTPAGMFSGGSNPDPWIGKDEDGNEAPV